MQDSWSLACLDFCFIIGWISSCIITAHQLEVPFRIGLLKLRLCRSWSGGHLS